MPKSSIGAFPVRLKYVPEMVGAFIVAAALLLVAALVLAPQTYRIFTRSQRLILRLPAEGSMGLRPGADVMVMGNVVGSVDDITLNDSGSMEAEVSIRGNFGRFIRSDSKAYIRRPLGIGDAMVEIVRGYASPLDDRSGVPTIDAIADKAPTEIVDETLREVRSEALPALRDLRNTISQYGALATDLRQRQAQMDTALNHFNNIADRIERGDGLAGTLINDPKLARDVVSTVSSLRKSVDQLQQELVQTSPPMQAISKSAVQLPQLLLQAQETLRQVQRLSEAAQRSWLIGGKTPAEESGELTADQAGSSK